MWTNFQKIIITSVVQEAILKSRYHWQDYYYKQQVQNSFFVQQWYKLRKEQMLKPGNVQHASFFISGLLFDKTTTNLSPKINNSFVTIIDRKTDK